MTSKTTSTPRLATPHALIAGGGSGGHVFPGLAVATELEARGWTTSWAGRPAGMERQLVRDRGLDYHPLPALPFVGRGLGSRIRALSTVSASAFRARFLVRRLSARVVLGTGGYVSAPAVIGARLAGVPALLLEPNADPGFANRQLSRFASEALLADPAAATGMRCPSLTTGVPVRADFFAVAPHLPYGQPLRVLVLGGSQGARSLNQNLPLACTELEAAGASVWIRHQCGAAHVESTRAAYRTAGLDTDSEAWLADGPRVQATVMPFVDDVALAMAESHLIVSRAGAITLAEICAAGRPSLLQPLTLAAGHQAANARRLVDAGAASVLAPDASPDDMRQTLDEALGDVPRLERMAAAARDLGRADAAQAIADRLEHWARRRQGDLPATGQLASSGGVIH